MDAVEDIVRSAYGQGFKRILVLNGHGGNSGLKTRLTELANELPGLKMQWYAWWMAHSVEEVAIRHELKPSHANWLEAFPFTIVADLPEGEKIPPHVPSDIMDAQSSPGSLWRWVFWRAVPGSARDDGRRFLTLRCKTFCNC